MSRSHRVGRGVGREGWWIVRNEGKFLLKTFLNFFGSTFNRTGEFYSCSAIEFKFSSPRSAILPSDFSFKRKKEG